MTDKPATAVVEETGWFDTGGPRIGDRWTRWHVYLDSQYLGVANSEDEGWRWIEDMRKMHAAELRCRICGGVNDQHDGATHDARTFDLPPRSERVR